MSVLADASPPSGSSHVRSIQVSPGELNTASNELSSTAHPINFLADELLSEIFYHCIPHNRNPRLVSEAPLLLTLVCQRWRGISISTPQLWNRVHILYMDDCEGYDAWRDIIAGIETWLTRSGTLPLSISILYRTFQRKYKGSAILSCPSQVAIRHPAFYRCLTMLIARHAPRWSTFLYVGNFELLEGIMKALPQEDLTPSSSNPLQNITSFRAICKLSWTRRMGEAFPIPLLPIFTAPTLRELALQDWHPDLTHVKWQSITQLSIHFPIERSIALAILSQCIGLEACALDINTSINSASHQLPLHFQQKSFAMNPPYLDIELPRLKTLCIQGESDDEQSIWHLLHTPNLRHFLYYPHPKRPFSVFHQPHLSPLSIFLNQCSSLESLTINPAYIPDVYMLAILQSCPRIVKLVLDQHYRDKYPKYGFMVIHSTLKFNLHPLFKQERVLDGNGTRVARLAQPLLKDLKSLSLLGFHISDLSTLEMLVDFCIDRVYTNRGPNPREGSLDGTMCSADDDHSQPPATLERIEMRLSGVGCDISSIICLYAESVGRKVGEDLIVDISYPVMEEDDKQGIWPFVDN